MKKREAGVCADPRSVICQICRIIINSVFWTSIAIMISLFVILICVVPFMSNTSVSVVLSGSMEPALHTGDLIYFRQTPANQISVGDIVVYETGRDMKVVHRCQSIDEEKQTMITKGDANDVPDISPVPFKNVKGRVMFHLAYFGYVIVFIEKFKWILICLFTVACIFPLLYKEYQSRKKEQEENNET